MLDEKQLVALMVAYHEMGDEELRSICDQAVADMEQEDEWGMASQLVAMASGLVLEIRRIERKG